MDSSSDSEIDTEEFNPNPAASTFAANPGTNSGTNAGTATGANGESQAMLDGLKLERRFILAFQTLEEQINKLAMEYTAGELVSEVDVHQKAWAVRHDILRWMLQGSELLSTTNTQYYNQSPLNGSNQLNRQAQSDAQVGEREKQETDRLLSQPREAQKKQPYVKPNRAWGKMVKDFLKEHPSLSPSTFEYVPAFNVPSREEAHVFPITLSQFMGKDILLQDMSESAVIGGSVVG